MVCVLRCCSWDRFRYLNTQLKQLVKQRKFASWAIANVNFWLSSFISPSKGTFELMEWCKLSQFKYLTHCVLLFFGAAGGDGLYKRVYVFEPSSKSKSISTKWTPTFSRRSSGMRRRGGNAQTKLKLLHFSLLSSSARLLQVLLVTANNLLLLLQTTKKSSIKGEFALFEIWN